MSIIHDALKKTQNNLNNNSPEQEATNKMNTENTASNTNSTPPANTMSSIYDKLHKKTDTPQKPNHPKSPAKKSNQKNESQGNPVMTFFTVIFCLLIIAGAIWFIYQYYAQNMEKTGVDLKKVLTIKPQKIYIIGGPKTYRPKPITKEDKNLPPDTIILNGITMMGEKRVALINNEIYQLGESVQGKKIVSISIEKVELEDNAGNITTLKVKGF